MTGLKSLAIISSAFKRLFFFFFTILKSVLSILIFRSNRVSGVSRQLLYIRFRFEYEILIFQKCLINSIWLV